MVYENKQDWQEKYDNNKLDTRQDAIDTIINEETTTERRNDRNADHGDEIILDGQTFIVNDIYTQQLKTLTDENAQQEGYKNLDEYKDSLTSIHEGAVWDPEIVVWTHELIKK